MAQGGIEVVRGRITDTRQAPVADAFVTITGDATGATRTVRTDSTGRYSAVFVDPESSYSVLVRKVGSTPAITRALRTGMSNVLLADVALASSPYPLEPLTVRARNTHVSNRAEHASIGGSAEDLLLGAQYVIDPSDVSSLVALALGVQASGGGSFSVMGAPPEQNGATLDGMTFGAGNVPPDAICGMSLLTTTSDPSHGRFTGGLTSMTSCRGLDHFQSTVRGSLVDPHLSLFDAESGIAPSRLATASGFVSGPLATGNMRYRLSFSGDTRNTFAPTLAAPRQLVLSQLGLLADTIAAVSVALSALNPRLTTENPQNATGVLDGSAFLRADWSPGSSTSIVLTANGLLSQSSGLGLNESSFPSTSYASSVRRGGVMLRGSTYLGGALDEVTVTFEHAVNSSAPDVMSARGSVWVGSHFADGRTSLASIEFGGSSDAINSTTTTRSLRNRFSVIPAGGIHQFSFGQEVSSVRSESLNAADSLGTFVYASLADLSSNIPESYTRLLGATVRSSGYSSGAAWVSDVWRISAAAAVEGGLRLDVTKVADAPGYNPLLNALFGLRTDHVPMDAGVSPRIGFAWLVRKQPPRTIKSPITGQMVTVRDLDDADAPGGVRGNFGSGITLFGGLGAYHGIVPPAQLTSLADLTGLPGTARMLSCVGSATPIPLWSAGGGTLFSACRNGTGAVPFGSDQPDVAAFGSSFTAPTDWKANIGVSGLTWRGWSANITGVVRKGWNGESHVDVNLQRNVEFVLPGEANRPVYASIDGIDPRTGLIAPNSGRISAAFHSVFSTISDVHSTAEQLNVFIRPPALFRNIHVGLEYSLNTSSAEVRGFDGNTAGDPFRIQAVSAGQPLHQFQLFAPTAKLWWLDVGMRLAVSSGAAYTPTVVGDINGDGLANDRAFVADPAVTADSALAAQLKALIAAAPRSARKCLTSQLGMIAAPNSCRGSWRGRLDVSVRFAPPKDGPLGNRLELSATLLNAGAGIMHLFGAGDGSVLGSPPPDSRLLFVTGFDPQMRRFAYRVNQAFGQPLSLGIGTNRLAPIQLKVLVSYALGRASTTQGLRRLGLDPARDGRQTDYDLFRIFRFYARNPVDTMLALGDSLNLTASQTSALTAIDTAFRASADSLAAPLVSYVRERGRHLTDDDIYAPLVRFTSAVSSLRTGVRDKALSVLSPNQRVKFTAFLAAGGGLPPR